VKKPLKLLALWKREYLGLDPEFFAGQEGSGYGSGSKNLRKMGSGYGLKKTLQQA
jgi:hypothetical protein